MTLISAERILGRAIRYDMSPNAPKIFDPLFAPVVASDYEEAIADSIMSAWKNAGLKPSPKWDCNRVTKFSSTVVDMHMQKSPDADEPAAYGMFGFWSDRYNIGHMVGLSVHWDGEDIVFRWHEPNPALFPYQCMGDPQLTKKEIASCVDLLFL